MFKLLTVEHEPIRPREGSSLRVEYLHTVEYLVHIGITRICGGGYYVNANTILVPIVLTVSILF